MTEIIIDSGEDYIEDQYNEALVLTAEGIDPYPGSTWADGVVAALGWVLGEREEPPVDRNEMIQDK